MIQTRHVLTGQIPPQQQPLGHGQQLCEVSSPSKGPMKGNGLEKLPCVNCDLDFGDMSLSQGHDTIA